MATSDLRDLFDDDAVADVALSATEAACLNRYPLLDFEEYREVRL